MSARRMGDEHRPRHRSRSRSSSEMYADGRFRARLSRLCRQADAEIRGELMPDKSFLNWPFFEEHHRRLAVELDAWCEREMRDFDHDENVDAACRKVVKNFGDAGWLKYAVP